MRHKKAVSPVVATLLLILIAVAASLVLYAWVSSLSSEAKGSGAERTGAAFVVEAAQIDTNTPQNVTVYVRNVGSVPIENGTWSLYALDPTTGTVVASNTAWTFNQTIGPGELVSTNVTVSGLVEDEYYIIKVVSPQGQSDSAYVKAE